MQILCKRHINKKNIIKARYLEEEYCEKHLWKAVLCQAIEDATSNSFQKRKIRAKKRAIKWLTEDNEDFRFVCDMAGFCHKEVKENIGTLIQKEDIAKTA